jgi:hypothetical protein
MNTKYKTLLIKVQFDPEDKQEENELEDFIQEILDIYLPNDYFCKVYNYDRKIKLNKILKNKNQ